MGQDETEQKVLLGSAVVRTGATSAIAPVDFWKEALIAAVVQNSIYILAPMDLNF